MTLMTVLQKIEELNHKPESNYMYLLSMDKQEGEIEGFKIEYKREPEKEMGIIYSSEEKYPLVNVFYNRIESHMYLKVESTLAYEYGSELVEAAGDLVAEFFKQKVKELEKQALTKDYILEFEADNGFMIEIIKGKLPEEVRFLLEKKRYEDEENDFKTMLVKMAIVNPFEAGKKSIRFIETMQKQIEENDDFYFVTWESSNSFTAKVGFDFKILYKTCEYEVKLIIESEKELNISIKRQGLPFNLEADYRFSAVYAIENESFEELFEKFSEEFRLASAVTKVDKMVAADIVFEELFDYVDFVGASLNINSEVFCGKIEGFGVQRVPFLTNILNQMKSHEIELSDVLQTRNESNGDLVTIGVGGLLFKFEAENDRELMDRFEITELKN